MKKYPFKFLDPYNSSDTEIFFGRDEEIGILYEMAFQSSILLVYGASGTGKTSLIQCGLARKFQTHDWLALTIRRGNNINQSLDKVLNEAMGDWDAGDLAGMNSLSPIARSLKAIYLNYFRPIYLIFDQFEELYILGTKEEQSKFIATIHEILQVEQPVKMIFSIREEYLGFLDEFEREVPQLLRKKLRVEPMNLEKVEEVIKGATEYKNSNITINPDETIAVAKTIFDKIKDKEKTLTIQLPYLQVFLDKLYLEITHDESRKADATFTMKALDEIGDIGDVLRDFLQEQMARIISQLKRKFPDMDTKVPGQILSAFVTLEGTKEPISKKTLYERLPDLNRSLVDTTLELFINSRIVSYYEDVDLYEIAHDSLAQHVAETRTEDEIALLEVKRIIKNQVVLNVNARELFTEKQLNFFDPYIKKLNLTVDEDAFIKDSVRKVAETRAEREREEREEKEQQKREQEAEKNRLLEKQRMLKRFNRFALATLVFLVVLVIWALSERHNALQEQLKAEKAYDSLQKQQSLTRAAELKAFGDGYYDLGKISFARMSYDSALFAMKDYTNEKLYKELLAKVKLCK